MLRRSSTATTTLFPSFVPPAKQKSWHPRKSTGPEFETLIELSARCCPRLTLEKLPKAGAQFAGPGKYFPQPICCDFIGVIASRPIFFDAKSRDGNNLFRGWSDPKIIKPHQKEFLIRMGEAGAVSGILAEANELARVYWMPWQLLKLTCSSIEWEDPRVYLVDYVRLGQTLRFQQLVGWAIQNVAGK